MATKKKVVNEVPMELPTTKDIQERMYEELRKMNEYHHRMDWKMWVILQMVQQIAIENGYQFNIQGLTGDGDVEDDPEAAPDGNKETF